MTLKTEVMADNLCKLLTVKLWIIYQDYVSNLSEYVRG